MTADLLAFTGWENACIQWILSPVTLLLQICYTWLMEQSVRIAPLKANYFAAALICWFPDSHIFNVLLLRPFFLLSFCFFFWISGIWSRGVHSSLVKYGQILFNWAVHSWTAASCSCLAHFTYWGQIVSPSLLREVSLDFLTS